MDPLLTRILLTIFLCPFATVLFIMVFATMERRLQDEFALSWAAISTGFLVCTWMILLWRSQIRWTTGRRWRTALSIPAAAGLGLGVGWAGEFFVDSYSGEFFRVLGHLLALAIWPVMAAFAWKETAEERALRSVPVSCPVCGYDLRGLSECRCAECGRQYTLDGLYAAQRRTLAERVREA